MNPRTLALVALAGLLATACATNPDGTTANPNTMGGAAIGAAAGALGGYFSSGNSDDRRINAVLGAGVGALAGGAVGKYMDNQEAAMRQSLQGTGVDVERQGYNLMLTMPNNVTFGFDDATLQASARTTLATVAGVLNQYPSTMVDVVGHTDSVGTDSYNMNLSHRRAQAVTSYLIGQSVVSQRLVMRGMGEQFPVADNATESGRAQNRRVEVLIAPVREGM
ncbi:MAG: OmpA family protein [Alphaproteobacteria bacterium]